ncbi:MAG: phage tail tape measure protein [bacterium]
MSFTIADLQAILRLDKGNFSSELRSAESDFDRSVSRMETGATKSSKGLGIVGAAAVGGIAGAAVGAVAAAGDAITGTITGGLNAYKNLEDAAASAAAKAVDVNGKSQDEIKAQYTELRDHVMGVSRDLGAATVFDPGQVASSFDEIAASGYDISKVGNDELRPMLDLAASDMEYGLGNATKLTMSTLSQFNLTMEDSARVADVYAKGAAGSAAGLADFEYAMKMVGPVASQTGMSLEETTAIIGKLADKGYQGEMSGTALRTALLNLGAPTKAMSDALAKYGLTLDDINPRTHSFLEILDTLKAKGVDVYDFGEIFGKEGAAIISSVAGMTEEVRGFTTELENAKGVARTMADLKLDSLGGVWEEAKGAASELAITLGENLKPAAESILKTFSSIAPKIKEFINAVFQGDFKKIGSLIQEGFQGALGYVRSFVSDATAALSNFDFSGFGRDAANVGISIGKSIYDGIVNTNWVNVIKTVTGILLGGISAFASYGLTIGQAIYSGIVNTNWTGLASRIWNGIKSVATYFAELGTSLFNSLNNINWSGVGSKAAQEIQSLIEKAIDGLSDIGSRIASFIDGFSWQKTGSDVGSKLKSGIEAIKGWADKLKEGFLNGGWEETGRKVATTIQSGVSKITDWYRGLKDSLTTWATGNDPKTIGQKAGQAVVDALKIAFETGKSALASALDLANAIADHFRSKGGGNIVTGAIKEVIDWAKIGIEGGGQFLQAFTSEILGGIANAISSSIMEGIIAGMNGLSGLPYIGDTIGGWADEARTQLDDIYAKQAEENKGKYKPFSDFFSNTGTSSNANPNTQNYTPTLEAGETYEVGPDGKMYQVVGSTATTGSSSADLGLAAKLGATGEVFNKAGEIGKSKVRYGGKVYSPEEFAVQLAKEGRNENEIVAVLEDIKKNTKRSSGGSSFFFNENNVKEAISPIVAAATTSAAIQTQSSTQAGNNLVKYVTASGEGLYTKIDDAGSVFAIYGTNAGSTLLNNANKMSALYNSTWGSVNQSIIATNFQARDTQLSAANTIASLGLNNANSILTLQQNGAVKIGNSWGNSVDLSQDSWITGVEQAGQTWINGVTTAALILKSSLNSITPGSTGKKPGIFDVVGYKQPAGWGTGTSTGSKNTATFGLKDAKIVADNAQFEDSICQVDEWGMTPGLGQSLIDAGVLTPNYNYVSSKKPVAVGDIAKTGGLPASGSAGYVSVSPNGNATIGLKDAKIVANNAQMDDAICQVDEWGMTPGLGQSLIDAGVLTPNYGYKYQGSPAMVGDVANSIVQASQKSSNLVVSSGKTFSTGIQQSNVQTKDTFKAVSTDVTIAGQAWDGSIQASEFTWNNAIQATSQNTVMTAHTAGTFLTSSANQAASINTVNTAQNANAIRQASVQWSNDGKSVSTQFLTSGTTVNDGLKANATSLTSAADAIKNATAGMKQIGDMFVSASYIRGSSGGTVFGSSKGAWVGTGSTAIGGVGYRDWGGAAASAAYSGGYTGSWGNSSFHYGYDSGGISTAPQIAAVSERGQAEIHLTQRNVDEFFGIDRSSSSNKPMTIIFEVNGKQMAREIMPYAINEVKRIGLKTY